MENFKKLQIWKILRNLKKFNGNLKEILQLILRNFVNTSIHFMDISRTFTFQEILWKILRKFTENFEKVYGKF